MYLGITRVNGYIEEKDSNKYLVFDSTDENKELLKKYSDVFNAIMSKIREIDDDWFEYAKDYMKIKFSSDDDLPLVIKSSLMTITIRCVFKEYNKLYPQVFLDDTLYELQKWYNTKESIFQKELILKKQINQKNVCFVIIGIFYIRNLVMDHIFVMTTIIFLKNLEILKILLLFIF